VGDESSLSGTTVSDGAGTTEPPADDTYSSTVVRVDTSVEDIVSTLADSDSAVTEHAAQHLPAASEQSAPELTASTVVNSVRVPSTKTSPVDVEYASTTTVSMVVDIVRSSVAVEGVLDSHVSVMVLVIVTVTSVVQGSETGTCSVSVSDSVNVSVVEDVSIDTKDHGRVSFVLLGETTASVTSDT
jgi:hypothetical protein